MRKDQRPRTFYHPVRWFKFVASEAGAPINRHPRHDNLAERRKSLQENVGGTRMEESMDAICQKHNGMIGPAVCLHCEIERLRNLLQNGSPVVEGTIQHMAMEIAALKKDAADLWMMLDDIDTGGDIAKADDVLYRAIAERSHKRRFETRYEWVMQYIDALAKLGADKEEV